MKENFYRAFEERYRGSRENIKEKQKVYLPFIDPLHKRYPEGTVLDIGCGRGEWLEIMHDQGIIAKGVDLDEKMMESGLSLGLDIEKEDGITFLRRAKDKSAIAITAFHVVEHISFDELHDFVNESMRVLKPGGLLILETPNPENIRIACENFYLDPTHLRPIPSGLLTFIAEYYGFTRTKIVRLQESELLSAQQFANIGHVLEGVSPDYALLAQKDAEPEILTLLDTPFSIEYGLSLSNLVEKFERRMLRFEELVDTMITKADESKESAWKAEISAAESKESAWKAEVSAIEAKERALKAEDSAAKSKENALKAEVSAIEAKERALKAENSANYAYLEYQKVINSRSWRITKPLRYTINTMKHIKVWILTFPKRAVKSMLRYSRQIIYRYPKLKMKLLKILNYFPRLKQKIKQLTISNDIDQQLNDNIKIDPPKTSFLDAETVSNDLQKAIEKQIEKK